MKRIGFIDGRRVAGWRFPATATPGPGQVIDITDNSLGAVGSIAGRTLKFRPKGAKTGNPYVMGDNVELYPEGDSGYLSARSTFVAVPVGTPALNVLWGHDIYMERLGGCVVSEYCGISIGMDNTNAPVSRAAFIRAYAHGSVAMQDVIYLPAALGVTNLIRFEHQVIPLIAAAVGGVQALKIRVDVMGTPYYIPLHTA